MDHINEEKCGNYEVKLKRWDNFKMKEELILIILISTAILLVRYGGFTYSSNNGDLPIVYRFANKNYLVNDWFVNCNDSFNVKLYFSIIMNLLNSIINNYEITCLILFFITGIGLGIGLFKISLLLTKNPNIALFTTCIILMGEPFVLGNNQFIHSVLDPSTIAWFFAIWGLYFFLKRKYSFAFILLGIASVAHFLIGLISFGIFFLAGLMTKQYYKDRISIILNSCFFIVIFFVNMIPLILFNLENSLGLSSETLTYILGRVRHPHHYMPFSWNFLDYVTFFSFFILFVIAFKSSKIDRKYKDIFKHFVLIIFGLFLIGTVFVEIFPIKWVTISQLFRSCVLLVLIEYIFIGEYIYRRITNGEIFSERVFFILTPLAMLHRYFIILYIVVFLPIIFLKKFYGINVFKAIQENINNIILISLVLIFIVIYIFKAQCLYLVEFIGTQQGRIVYILMLSLLYFLFYFIIVVHKNQDKYRLIILIILLVVTCATYLIFNPLIGRYKYDNQTEQLYDFIKRQTDSSVVLLTPPYIDTFRLGAERAIVVDFRSMPFHETGMVEWYRRIRDVSNNISFTKRGFSILPELKADYNSLNESDIKRLQTTYNFSYAIFEKPKHLNFPVFYENEKFIVYESSVK